MADKIEQVKPNKRIKCMHCECIATWKQRRFFAPGSEATPFYRCDSHNKVFVKLVGMDANGNLLD